MTKSKGINLVKQQSPWSQQSRNQRPDGS